MSIFGSKKTLLDSQDFESSFFENTNFAIVDVDRKGNILRANRFFSELSKYNLKTLVKLQINDLLYNSTEIIPELFEKSGIQNIKYESRLITSKKEYIFVRISVFIYNISGSERQVCRLLIEDIGKSEESAEELRRYKWLTESGDYSSGRYQFTPYYGDVTELNTERLILDSIEKETFKTITIDVMELLDTSVAIYERNGDYAFGLFESSWCRLMDESSRKLCGDVDNKTALSCGKWLCHENCWNVSAKAAIESEQATDIGCIGGIRLYAEPIWSNHKVIGAINIGYSNPPQDERKLKNLSKRFHIDIEQLRETALSYNPRPPFIIELAKRRLKSIAILIGKLVELKITERELSRSQRGFKLLSDVTFEGILLHKNGIVYDVNNSFCRMTGYSKAESIGSDILKYIGDEESLQRVKGNLLKDHANPYKITIKRKDGSSCLTEIEARNIEYSDDVLRIVSLRDVTERENVQRKMRESISQFKTLFNQAPEMLFVHDDTGSFIEVNKSTERQYGYSREELLAMKVCDIDPDFNKRNDIKTVWLKVEEEKPFKFTGRHKRKDGSLFPVEISITKVIIDNKKQYFSMIRDLTEQIEKEKEIRESEERFRTMLENIPDPVLIQDGLTGQVLDANISALKKYGYSKEEIVKLSPSDFDVPEESVNIPRRLEKLRKEKMLEFNTKHINKSGKVMDVRYHGHYFVYKERPLILSICRDVSEEKKANMKLRQSEEMFRFIAENSIDCLWQMDKRLKFTYLSPALYQMSGYKPEEWVGTPLWEHTSRKEFIKMGRLALNMMKQYKTFNYVTFETKMYDKNGDLMPLEINSKPLFKNGKVAGLQGSTRLITERVKQQEEIRRYQENLEQLVKERTEELEAKNKELTEYNRVFVGREFRIKELRDYVKQLEQKLCEISGKSEIREILSDKNGYE